MSTARTSTKDLDKGPFEPLEVLRRLKDAATARRYPNVPERGRIKAKYDDRTTNGLTACCMDWLRLNGHFCARINTTGLYDEKLRRYRPSGATVGVCDLIACIHGSFAGIEIKTGADKMRPEQKEVADQIRASLGHFVEVRSFAQFYRWYEEITRPPFA